MTFLPGQVTEDTEGMRFNTAISAMMEFANAAQKWKIKPRSLMEPFVLLLAPYAPHLAEELWERMGHGDSLSYVPWPEWKDTHLQVASIDLPVQINGKKRGTVKVVKGADEDTAFSVAIQAQFTQRFIEGKDVQKVIFVPDRIINIIVK